MPPPLAKVMSKSKWARYSGLSAMRIGASAGVYREGMPIEWLESPRRFRAEDGRQFTLVRPLTVREARRMSRGHRVLASDFPLFEDVTGDAERIHGMLHGVREDRELFAWSAALYAAGDEKIVVFDWGH